MFTGFMVNAWVVATVVAVVGAAVGFFVVMRGSAFVAHAIPNGSFAGAAGASLIGVNAIVGLGVFSVAGALGIGLLGRRGRHDVATALTLVFMLGLGALFLSFKIEYAPAVYSLLFGEVLGISTNQLWPTVALALVCLTVLMLLWRPLLLASVLPSSARGLDPFKLELYFLLLVALATTMTVPVVGTALIFSLMIGPAAAARAFTVRPHVALALAVAIAVAIVWIAIASSYSTNWPVGFFVGVLSASAYTVGRLWSWTQRHGAGGRSAGAGGRGAGAAEPLRVRSGVLAG